jgi:hypothetical protein
MPAVSVAGRHELDGRRPRSKIMPFLLRFALRRSLALVAFAAWTMFAGSVRLAVADGLPPAGLDEATKAALSETVRGLLVEALPEQIEVRDDWGKTEAKFSGLTWRMDRWKLSVDKREKDKNHGLWKQIEIVPVEPAKNLQFQIVHITSHGPRHVAFQLRMASPLQVKARLERWRSGVKLFNLVTEADATVEANLAGEVLYDFQTTSDGTFLTFAPKINAVDLKLIDFHWKRIGPADGWAVHELGKVVDDPLAKQLDRQEPKAVEKLNQAITKRQDKWRVKVAAPFGFDDLTNWFSGK